MIRGLIHEFLPGAKNTVKPQVRIYTDGACKGNPGPGGWAALIYYPDREVKLTGCEPVTTNNRMELTAVIEALRALEKPSKVTIYSDSRYVTAPFNEGWIRKWRLNGWKTYDGRAVANRTLWQELLNLLEPHEVTWVWVKGHSENEINALCDRLANEAAATGGGSSPRAT